MLKSDLFWSGLTPSERQFSWFRFAFNWQFAKWSVDFEWHIHLLACGGAAWRMTEWEDKIREVILRRSGSKYPIWCLWLNRLQTNDMSHIMLEGKVNFKKCLITLAKPKNRSNCCLTLPYIEVWVDPTTLTRLVNPSLYSPMSSACARITSTLETLSLNVLKFSSVQATRFVLVILKVFHILSKKLIHF